MQSDAIADWQAILGPAHVLIDEEQRHRAGTATFASPHGDRPVVLQPGSTEEVMACMHVARRCGIALYPVSRGRNWGYGSAVPFRAGCVILSLARLQRISAFHETLGHVTVEPGVTFGQLNDFLRAQGSALFLNCPGSGAGASVLGLHLEKGLIPGPDADRWEQMCSLDVILPGGERIQTGLASITGARAAACARAGIGPVTEGLFLQSGLGIVVGMTIWLSALPAYLQYFSFAVDSGAKFERCVEQLRSLKQTGTLGACIALHNDFQRMASTYRYPWAETGGEVPLPALYRDAFRQRMQGALWFGEGAIEAADEDEGSAKRKRLGALLADCTAQLQFDVPGTINSFNNPGLRTDLHLLYWRKRTPVPAQCDPHRDACGIIWITAAVPFLPAEVQRCTALIEQQMLQVGFEPCLTLRPVSSRLVYVLTALIYDRAVAGQDQAAMQCYEQVSASLLQAGYIPYRLGLQGMDLPLPISAGYRNFLRTIKQAIDPQAMVAPGRYAL